MKVAMTEAHARGDHSFSHFGPESNLFEELEELFRTYAETGSGKVRRYLHDDEEAAPYNQSPGTFTPWADLPADSDLLFYEACTARSSPRRSTSRSTPPTCSSVSSR